MITYTLQIDGMYCPGCALLIDDALEDVPGVAHAETRFRDGHATVHVDPDRCTAGQLIAAITEAGYAAHVVRAVEP